MRSNTARALRSSAAQGPVPRSFVSAPPDVVLFGAVGILVAIGLVMIYSASSAVGYAESHDTAYYLKRQSVQLVIGLFMAYAAYRVDYRKLRPLAPYVLVLSILSLAAVLVPHVGVVVNGARRWIGAGTLSIQPSEFAKLSLVRGLVPMCVPVAIMAMLILKEPDMGTASLLAFTSFTMFFVAGARMEHLFLIFMVTIPTVVLSIVASPYKRARIFAFIDPWKDAQNTGFHIVQSLFALGTGGLFGVGLGQSRAKFFYLPEQYTDFIFSVLGEELGLIGAAGVVILFLVFAYRAARIAIAAPDRFGFFLAVGCTALIVIQAFVNIGVVTSSWPVTGVPLPFISFGGSSLVVCMVAVALILNVGCRRRVDL